MPETNERNALAELAERLDTRKSKDFIVRIDAHDVSLARRIVAELAKVETDSREDPWIDTLITAFENCREIAEEGPSND